MFDYIFQEYIETAYKPSMRRLTVFEKFLMGTMAATVIACIIFALLRLGKAAVYCLCALFAVVGAIYIRYRYSLKHDREERFARYQKRLAQLETLLEDKKYGEKGLYHQGGLDWIIECGEAKVRGAASQKWQAAIKEYFKIIIFPMITLVFGIYISRASLSDSILYAVSVTGSIALVAFFALSLLEIYKDFFEKNEEICGYLLNDLRYLRAQLSGNPTEPTGTEIQETVEA
ncbi:MAG: hypothetical protein VB086_07500 [Clostridiaceae bacterium]|nr:hypothetical protein [Clostridiaceae bacterium]